MPRGLSNRNGLPAGISVPIGLGWFKYGELLKLAGRSSNGRGPERCIGKFGCNNICGCCIWCIKSCDWFDRNGFGRLAGSGDANKFDGGPSKLSEFELMFDTWASSPSTTIWGDHLIYMKTDIIVWATISNYLQIRDQHLRLTFPYRYFRCYRVHLNS